MVVGFLVLKERLSTPGFFASSFLFELKNPSLNEARAELGSMAIFANRNPCAFGPYKIHGWVEADRYQLLASQRSHLAFVKLGICSALLAGAGFANSPAVDLVWRCPEVI